VWFEVLLIGLFADGCLIVRTGLEGPGLTKSQKLWYCLAMVGGRYSWGRLQLISAFHRWGDQERVRTLHSIGFAVNPSLPFQNLHHQVTESGSSNTFLTLL
jgi:hypothetical protein